MSIENDKIVMPGDKLGIIEQYLPGEGTYDDNGDIKSAVLGNVKINQKMKVISVVSDAKPRRYCLWSNNRYQTSES